MIVGNVFEMGVQLEYVLSFNSPSGIFNFIVDDKLMPGRGVVMDLYVIISSLKGSINDLEGVADIGGTSLEALDFSNGSPDNVVFLDVSELSDYGCVFWLGFDGEEDRFFYSLDYEETIQEKRFPRGTVEKLLRCILHADSLEIKKIENMVAITDLR
ncbi:Imm42 family immunity protein [Chromobacterium haemolyticum]|uniref:Imm42 family immunity protein n=1 Tax=Chromobacterium haemolyticum TaxID=394935 RepID=UPI000D2F86EA|nr:Imm42 family immunity protein [Chromobacterium haemolyticum]PTU70391.1 hypothetical protein DBB33_13495 [Chromobacterium haemolyticum]